MIKILIGAAVGVTVLVSVFLAGVNTERSLNNARLAEAKAAFEKTIREANQAYANQKILDDRELEALRQQAMTAPPNTTIAIKKDMGKRIGGIR